MSSLLSTEDRKCITDVNCFDFLRYLFAISLIIAHFCTLVQVDQFWFISGGMRVKAFFVITGFLVSYSFMSRSCNVKMYAKKRFVRIIPAYVAVILFGLIIGAVFTNVGLLDFLSNSQTHQYAVANLCMLNWLQPSLPGLFEGNFMTPVNGSLWSMKFEVLFYLMVPFFIWLFTKINRHIFALVTAAGIVLITLWDNVPCQLMYFTYFFAGLLGLVEFTYFKRYIWVILLSCVALILTEHIAEISLLTQLMHILEPFIFASVLLGVAYTCRFLGFFRRLPNVTYGLYLYHFPVIQILVSLGLAQYNLWLCFATAVLLTFGMANFSWFVIEKPLMEKYK